VKRLSDYPRELARLQNRLRWHLHELDRGLQISPAGCAGIESSMSWSGSWMTPTAWWRDWPASSWSASGT